MTMIVFARKQLLALLFVVGLLAATCGATFQPTTTYATARQPHGDIRVQGLRSICANSVSVRNEPGGSIVYGTLYGGQSFNEYGRSGAWSYGYAYGSVNREGWVLTQYLC